jgi:putative nucleotidyltransferase with HDIG domain
LEQRVIQRTQALALVNAELTAEVAVREMAERNAIRQVERLRALRTIDMAINASLDLNLTLGIFLDQVLAHLKVDAAAVLLLDERALRLWCAAWRGFEGKPPLEWDFDHTDPIATRAALEARPTVEGADPRELQAAEDEPWWRRLGFADRHVEPLLAKGDLRGVLQILSRTPFDLDEDWLDYCSTLAGQAAIAVANVSMFDSLQESNEELLRAYDRTLEGWARALDLRDHETEGHSRRVTEMTVALARAMGVGADDMVHIRRGALLHDIGKIGVPDHILNKPGRLTEAEYETMQRHCRYAYDMLSPIEFLARALEIPYCHHEKWDGTGYPRGMKGEEIPLAARIFAAADVWDALASERPYKPAWSVEQMVQHFREQAGSHFDPHVARTMLRLVERGALPGFGRMANAA